MLELVKVLLNLISIFLKIISLKKDNRRTANVTIVIILKK